MEVNLYRGLDQRSKCNVYGEGELEDLGLSLPSLNVQKNPDSAADMDACSMNRLSYMFRSLLTRILVSSLYETETPATMPSYSSSGNV